MLQLNTLTLKKQNKRIQKEYQSLTIISLRVEKKHTKALRQQTERRERNTRVKQTKEKLEKYHTREETEPFAWVTLFYNNMFKSQTLVSKSKTIYFDNV